MPKFTSGPWRIEEASGGFIIRKGPKIIMRGEAEARLIAKAPELYDLARQLSEGIAFLPLRELRHLIDRARRVISEIDG